MGKKFFTKPIDPLETGHALAWKLGWKWMFWKMYQNFLHNAPPPRNYKNELILN